MNIKLDNLDSDDGFVLVICEEPDACQKARDDQTIAGSSWECDGSDFAYAIIADHPRLVEELEEEGYEVDDSEYCPPDEGDTSDT